MSASGGLLVTASTVTCFIWRRVSAKHVAAQNAIASRRPGGDGGRGRFAGGCTLLLNKSVFSLW